MDIFCNSMMLHNPKQNHCDALVCSLCLLSFVLNKEQTSKGNACEERVEGDI